MTAPTNKPTDGHKRQPRSHLRTWAAGLVLLQAIILGSIVWDREALLDTGREILLDVEPVDPRSLFRGDYVILNYQKLSRPDKALTDKVTKDREVAGGLIGSFHSPLAIILARAENADTWAPVRAETACPPGLDDKHVCLMGRISRHNTMIFGIENYFVPEGEGKKLENMIGMERLQVLVAVDDAGRSIIKGLVIDGTRIAGEGML